MLANIKIIGKVDRKSITGVVPKGAKYAHFIGENSIGMFYSDEFIQYNNGDSCIALTFWGSFGGWRRSGYNSNGKTIELHEII